MSRQVILIDVFCLLHPRPSSPSEDRVPLPAEWAAGLVLRTPLAADHAAAINWLLRYFDVWFYSPAFELHEAAAAAARWLRDGGVGAAPTLEEVTGLTEATLLKAGAGKNGQTTSLSESLKLSTSDPSTMSEAATAAAAAAADKSAAASRAATVDKAAAADKAADKAAAKTKVTGVTTGEVRLVYWIPDKAFIISDRVVPCDKTTFSSAVKLLCGVAARAQFKENTDVGGQE